MFLQVEVIESANCPLAMTRMFETADVVYEVVRVRTWDLMDVERMCDVTGWSSTTGPCPAYTALVDDSGEGIARLVYGGDEGIRLKPTDVQEEWSLESPHQWGEACLLLDKDVEIGY